MVFSVVEVVNSVYSYYKYEFGGKISAYSTFLRVLRLVYIYNKLGNSRFSFSWDAAKRMLNKSKYYIISASFKNA